MRRLPIAAVLVWAVCTVPALAAFPGENGRIAYTDGVDIRTINPDGSGDLQLTTDSDSAFDRDPEWSPDGQRILFTSDREGLGLQVYVMNADGSGQARLTDPPGWASGPAWSPDGQRIVFVRNGDLWLMSADGGGQVPLVSRPGNDAGPDWSPDGTRIAFTNGDIWLTSPDGTGLHRVPTETPPDAVTPPDEAGPEWSPDGERIAYVAFYTDVDDTDQFYTATVRPDGTGGAFLAPAYFFGPAWAPDGSRIAATDGTELFTMRPDGTDRLDLSPYAEDVDWQPLPVNTSSTYIRPKSAMQFRVALVPAFQACTSPNRAHGPPLAFGSCSPPQPQSARLSVGGGQGVPARSSGFVHLRVMTGAPGPPNDPDVKVRIGLTNVMHAADRSEYTGELLGELTVRRTDREPGSIGATSIDFPVGFAVPCAATPQSNADASSCSTTTTVNALAAGAIRDGYRTVWGLDKVRVYDGGIDGEADTASDNSLFATQGVFVP